MNDPTYVEAARALAQRVMKESKPKAASRAALAFQLATARPPSKPELAMLTRLAAQQAQHFKKAPEEAEALLQNGESEYDRTLRPADLATWTVVASAILNLDETISKE
jgi:hypothetical protein